ncbi:MAG TPA: cysteine hydrolase family protein [Thermoanaerobaculales bacterium]|nr:cysteine hydrolase family protein [Thermoanaerobaculales bacterium]
MTLAYLGCCIAAAVLVGLPAVVSAQTSEARPSALEGAALLVIDIQAFYYPGGRIPLVEPEAASANARRLVELFRTAGRPVIHVQHLPKGVDQPDPTGGDPQYRIHPDVLPAQGEVVIGKHHANAFRDTALLETLRGLGVTRLVICGMQTHMCVEAAVRAAADLGFEVTLVRDACATRALADNGVEVPAPQVHAAALAAMASSYATIVSTAEAIRPEGPAD